MTMANAIIADLKDQSKWQYILSQDYTAAKHPITNKYVPIPEITASLAAEGRIIAVTITTDDADSENWRYGGVIKQYIQTAVATAGSYNTLVGSWKVSLNDDQIIHLNEFFFVPKSLVQTSGIKFIPPRYFKSVKVMIQCFVGDVFSVEEEAIAETLSYVQAKLP